MRSPAELILGMFSMFAKKAAAISLGCGLLLAALVLYPVFFMSDGDPYRKTHYDLFLMGDALIEMHNRGITIARYSTITEFVSVAEKERMLDRAGENRFVKDAWRHPLHWIIQTEPEQLVVIVRSDGKNGLSEGGEGDDISVIVTLPQRGKAGFYLK